MLRTARYYQDQLDSSDPAHYPGQGPQQGPGYSNPLYEPQGPPRTPSRVTFGHRRTPSGSSNTFQYGDHERPSPGPQANEYTPPPLAPRRLSRQGSYGTDVERPQTL